MIPTVPSERHDFDVSLAFVGVCNGDGVEIQMLAKYALAQYLIITIVSAM